MLERFVPHHIAKMSETGDGRGNKTFSCAAGDFLKLKTHDVSDIFFICSDIGSKVFYLDKTSV